MKQIIVFLILILITILFVFGSSNAESTVDDKSKSIKSLNHWAKFFSKQTTFSIKKKEFQDENEILKKQDRADMETEYGVFADKDIKSNTELLSVKWTSCLTIDTIALEQRELFDEMVKLKIAQEDILMIGLIFYRDCMKSENYNLKHWIQSLPNKYESSLYFDGGEDGASGEMEYLKGSPAFVDIMVEKELAKEIYDSLSETLFKSKLILRECNGKPISWEQFKWAYATITARKIYVTDPDSTPTTVMTSTIGSDGKPTQQEKLQQQLSPVIPPAVDFFNHATDPSAEIDYDNDLGTIEVRTIKEIKKGDEIFVNYDHHYCGSDLLVDYGYLPNTINDKSCVNVLMEELLETISLDDPIKEEKYYLVKKLFESRDTKLKISMDSLTEDLLKISKYISYKSESLLEYLKKLVTLKLDHYPTTITQDKEFLQSPDYNKLSPRSKLAFNLSFQEKQILTNIFTKIQENIDNIDILEESSNNNNNNKEDKDSSNSNSNSKDKDRKVKDEL